MCQKRDGIDFSRVGHLPKCLDWWEMTVSQIKNIFSVCVFALLTAFLFHNCGNSSGIDFSGPGLTDKSSIAAQASGTGEGFFGKPENGDYDRKFPAYQCPSASGAQALLKVDSIQAQLLSDNCEARALPISFTDAALNFAPYDPDFIAYRGAIFEKRLANSTPDLNSISEVFCSVRTASEGFDVVVKRDSSATLRYAKIYYGEAIDAVAGFPGGWTGMTGSTGALQMTASDGDLRFFSSTEAFELTVNDTLNDQLTFPGHITMNFGSSAISRDVTCRAMSIKPVLWIDPTGLITYFKFDDPIYQDNGVYPDNLGRLSGTLLSGDANNKASTGVNGGALRTDGTNDRFFIPNLNNSLNVTNQLTVSVHVRITNLVPVTELQTIIQRQDPSTSLLNDYFVLAFVTQDAAFNPLAQPLLMFKKDGSTSRQVIIPWDLPPGYFHFVATDDGSTLSLYVDGQLRASAPSTGSTYIPTNSPICIGSAANLSTSCDGEYLGADFDEVSYWNRALRPDEVAALYGRRAIFP